MSFWSYLGLAYWFRLLFGKKKNTCPPTNNPLTPRPITDSPPLNYNPTREAELDHRFNSVADRIDALEADLDDVDPDSERYEYLYDYLESLQDKLDEIDEEQSHHYIDYDDYDDLDDFDDDNFDDY